MAFDRLQGLLAGGNPLFDVGVGLLAASGPRPVGTADTTSRLAEALQFASLRQRAAMENQAFRNHMIQQQELLERQRRQRSAQETIAGILAAPSESDPMGPGSGVLQTREQRLAQHGGWMGLLADAAPDATSEMLLQGLFAPQQQERSEPADVRTLRAIGIDPMSAEGRQIILDRLRTSGATDDVLKGVQLQLQSFQLDEVRRKREAEERTEAEQRRGLAVETKATFKKAIELAQLNDRLENTALETGQPFGEFYRGLIAGGAPFLERLGFDTADARATVADFDRFKKLTTDFGIGLIDRLPGTITNEKLQALRDTMAGIGTSPGANRLVISDLLQAGLEAADIKGVDVSNRAEIEAFIEQLRGGGVNRPEEAAINVPEAARAVGGTVQRAADIARMGVSQLRALDPSQMTNEMLEAAARRWEELTNGR